MRAVSQYAGESAAQYVERIENELADAISRLESAELEDESKHAGYEMQITALEDASADATADRVFLREQLTDLALQIRAPSAPRTRQQMARLLAGLLRGEDWRNGTWRR